MKNIKMIILFILAFTYCTIGCAFAKNTILCDKFFRIHIIANSNSSYDQAIKIMVRDYLFTIYDKEFKNFKSKDEAVQFASDNRITIENELNKFLCNLNYKYQAKVKIKNEYFPFKNYKDFTLPYGKYKAFKIILGNGKGKNFFCVMFPPVCVSNDTYDLSNYLNDNEEKKIKGKVIYKSKIHEIINKYF